MRIQMYVSDCCSVAMYSIDIPICPKCGEWCSWHEIKKQKLIKKGQK